MPKQKTKSAAKKRFWTTANGKVRHQFGYKRHNLRQKTQKMKRQHRGTDTLPKMEARRVKRYFNIK